MKVPSLLHPAPISFGASLLANYRRIARGAKRLASAPGANRGQYAAQGPVELLSCLNNTRNGLPYLKELVKLRSRSNFHYRATQQWLPFWNSTPILTEIARSTPCVLQKIYRPYLSNRFDCGERLEMITGHYAFMLQQGLGPMLLRAARYPVPLCTLQGKSGSDYQILLAAAGTLDREGELVLHLSAEGQHLYSIAFTFFAHGAMSAIGVGCLQGARSADSLERIRNATRDLHGLRPKTLLVRLVQQLGYHFGMRDLILVGNRNLVGQRHIRKGKVHADYDANWEEMGARRRPDGDYMLACAPMTEPDLAAIPSKKRSEAKKRHALLESVAGMTCTGFRRPLFAADVAFMDVVYDTWNLSTLLADD